MAGIPDYECPDCDYTPMMAWVDGKHPDGGYQPRIKCPQCRRWMWESEAKAKEVKKDD